MKNITRITRRLISLFLVLVASSMMFLSSPAVADEPTIIIDGPVITIPGVDSEGGRTETATQIGKSGKPVVVILAFESLLKKLPNYLEEAKTKAEKFFGDKYEIVIGKIDYNRDTYSKIVGAENTILYESPAFALFKYNDYVGGGYLSEKVYPSELKSIKERLDSVSY